MCGESLQAVQQFARHSNINTTMIYVHNIDRMNNDCSRRVASYLFGGLLRQALAPALHPASEVMDSPALPDRHFISLASPPATLPHRSHA